MSFSVKRLPGKNLSCTIVSGEVLGTCYANILQDNGPPFTIATVRDHYVLVANRGTCVNYTTEPRGYPEEAPESWRLMKAGKVNGLEEDPTALAGKHVLHQAISLAVHLGFSRVKLQVKEPEPRLRRALDSLVRPLRHRRVLVTGCAPFAEE